MGIEEFLLERAEKKGLREGKVAFVKSLLQNTDFNDEKIAMLVGVTVEFVANVKTRPE
jgi:hypothetical protein